MGFKHYMEEEREGRGKGNPAMGDGGTDKCYCPECDKEFEKKKGEPCAERTCPECGGELQGVKKEAEDFSEYLSGDELEEDYIADDEEYYDEDEEIERLDEVTAKRKKVVRGGKRVIKWVCPRGYRKEGKRCVRMSAADRRKLSKRAKRAARKSRSKRASAIRKRRISNKKRY